jgi:hypothetical protein
MKNDKKQVKRKLEIPAKSDEKWCDFRVALMKSSQKVRKSCKK